MWKACARCGMIHDTSYKCKVGLNKRKRYNYEESKLRNTYDWHKKAEDIKRASKYLCELCFNEGIYNYNDLEVHHIIKLREDKSKLLDNYNLICLCSRHHRLADSGMIDSNLLLELAKKREDQTE